MFEITQVPEFEKDMASLSKFPTINSDLKNFKNVLAKSDSGLKVAGWSPGKIAGAKRSKLNFKCSAAYIYKARRFYCEYLHCTDRIRVMYACSKTEKKIMLIEIYFKHGSKQNEDRARIFNYFGEGRNPFR